MVNERVTNFLLCAARNCSFRELSLSQWEVWVEVSARLIVAFKFIQEKK